MTRIEYMAQLEKHLKKLPHKEFQEAITFFQRITLMKPDQSMKQLSSKNWELLKKLPVN